MVEPRVGRGIMAPVSRDETGGRSEEIRSSVRTQGPDYNSVYNVESRDVASGYEFDSESNEIGIGFDIERYGKSRDTVGYEETLSSGKRRGFLSQVSVDFLPDELKQQAIEEEILHGIDKAIGSGVENLLRLSSGRRQGQRYYSLHIVRLLILLIAYYNYYI